MPKKTNPNYSQANDPRAFDQAQYGSTSSFDPSVGGYAQSGFDDYSGYQGHGSDTYAVAGYPDAIYSEEEEGQKKRGAGFYIGISIAAVGLVAAIAVGAFLFMNSTQIYPTFRSGELGQLDGKTKEEIQAELDRIVEEGMFNISIASLIQLSNGSAEGEFGIENSPANRYNMQVDITVTDTGETIYTSGVLEPNYHIQYAKLDTPLSAGTYNCVATFHALDPEKDNAEVGQASASITIVVIS